MSYFISELADLVGLSRSTLLYYEKKSLIKGKRQANGYRVYCDYDLQKLRLLKQLQAGGLTLHECCLCLESKIDSDLLARRLEQLEVEISEMQKARELLLALTGKTSMREWLLINQKIAPAAFDDWLQKQGFDERNIIYLKWLSKDMSGHEQYMADFMKVFQSLDRWGPGSPEDSLKALSFLPEHPHKILEIGCGKGVATALLAKHTDAEIIAVDNEMKALKQLDKKLVDEGIKGRVSTVCASMTDLTFPPSRFDLIWAEGAAYIMGVEKALMQWKPILKQGGYLVFSDLVWLTDSPGSEAVDFWLQEYPDIQSVSRRIKQIENAGYEVLSHFTLSNQAWSEYYSPLKQQVLALKQDRPDSIALSDLLNEVSVYEKHLGEFGYEMFILKSH
ncbi:Transcriptional regulator, MerR family [Nitrincola lacisaponensis]|uniref:Transcriptional regulator, MerR family n=1 Tax=Nitrincola lacisaponensis TaxID=267850 RepID=A0A063Y193_9GAMM|nr:methyltransferase domain-containing protein [Nitrincola lacisaponensis]KDE39444.1 Transcriptional regulator, MerR family [Nitrincola lacisaponensis]